MKESFIYNPSINPQGGFKSWRLIILVEQPFLSDHKFVVRTLAFLRFTKIEKVVNVEEGDEDS